MIRGSNYVAFQRLSKRCLLLAAGWLARWLIRTAKCETDSGDLANYSRHKLESTAKRGPRGDRIVC